MKPKKTKKNKQFSFSTYFFLPYFKIHIYETRQKFIAKQRKVEWRGKVKKPQGL